MYKLFLINGTTQVVGSKSDRKYIIDVIIKEIISILRNKYNLSYDINKDNPMINNKIDRFVLEMVKGVVLFTSDKEYIKEVILKFNEENKLYLNKFVIDDFEKRLSCLIQELENIEKEVPYFMFSEDNKLKGVHLDKLNDNIVKFLIRNGDDFELIDNKTYYFHSRYIVV